MDKNSTIYTVVFAATVCLLCGIAVASSAVGLRDKQETNKVIDKKSKVLAAAGLLPEQATATEISRLYDENVVPVVVNLQSGEPNPDIDAMKFDIKKSMKDPEASRAAPPNGAKVPRLPVHSIVYEIKKDGKTSSLVLPIQGKGLWSTMYGLLALSPDSEIIHGLIFYEHGETPGLGGEVDNPRWRQQWVGRKPFDENGKPVIRVIKGAAGSVEETPHHVDGLSGATITSRGVSDSVQFWLGDDGYGPALERYRAQHSSTQHSSTQHSGTGRAGKQSDGSVISN